MDNFSNYNFAPVMNYPEPHEMKVFDLSEGLNEQYIKSVAWGIGKYNEKRNGMYLTSQFGGRRNIHMGIDIWSKAGRPVFSFWDGTIVYAENNDQDGDYGPTLISRHQLGDQVLYALYGHLSRLTLQNISVGEPINKGQQIATLGDENENGGWPPHLHFQLSVEDPGKADMPGVVADEDHEEALEFYPDPRLVLGPLY